MKKYIETSWFYYYFDETHSQKSDDSNRWNKGVWKMNNWRVGKETLKEGLQQLADFCNKNSYEIKSVIPIDRAQSYEYGQTFENTSINPGFNYGMALGKGWGITMSDGFAAMLQRIDELTDEEYDIRISNVALENENKSLIDENARLSKLIESNDLEIPDLKIAVDQGIGEEKQGMLFKKPVYIVAGKKYPDKAHAEQTFKEYEAKLLKIIEENPNLLNKIAHNNKLIDEINEKMK